MSVFTISSLSVPPASGITGFADHSTVAPAGNPVTSNVTGSEKSLIPVTEI